jgi:hypothetical protein
MTTDNPSSVPVQPSQHNSISAHVSVTDARHCPNCSLSYIQYHQPLGGLDHPPGGDSAGSYPTMNYVSALPPTRYTSSMGYDFPPHLATVRVRLPSRVLFVDRGLVGGSCNCPWSTPARALCSYNSCTCSPAPRSLSSRAHATFLTAPLTVGGAQRPPPQSRYSSQ